jgi:hypothetical protein
MPPDAARELVTQSPSYEFRSAGKLCVVCGAIVGNVPGDDEVHGQCTPRLPRWLVAPVLPSPTLRQLEGFSRAIINLVSAPLIDNAVATLRAGDAATARQVFDVVAAFCQHPLRRHPDCGRTRGGERRLNSPSE